MQFSIKPFVYSLLVGLVFIFGQMNLVSFAGEMHSHRTGMLAGAGGHGADGSVDLKGHSLTLSNIDVDKVPDGRVYLANNAKYESGVELGTLKQFSGTVKYSIPENVNPDDYNSVLIWCKKFSVEIGHADLKAAMMK